MTDELWRMLNWNEFRKPVSIGDWELILVPKREKYTPLSIEWPEVLNTKKEDNLYIFRVLKPTPWDERKLKQLIYVASEKLTDKGFIDLSEIYRGRRVHDFTMTYK